MSFAAGDCLYHPRDQHPVDKMRERSKVVLSNGLNPVWNQSFEFKIEYPELAMLHIGVYHQVVPTSRVGRCQRLLLLCHAVLCAV